MGLLTSSGRSYDCICGGNVPLITVIVCDDSSVVVSVIVPDPRDAG